MSMSYIRKYYGVPAKRGMAITFRGESAKIVGSRNQYLRVRMTEDNKIDKVLTIHPTWEVNYLELAQEGHTNV